MDGAIVKWTESLIVKCPGPLIKRGYLQGLEPGIGSHSNLVRATSRGEIPCSA